MNRVLSTVALMATLAVAAGATAFAAHHPTRHAQAASAHDSGGAGCSDPAHCSVGSCAKSASTCSASCPTGCPHKGTTAVAANVTK